MTTLAISSPRAAKKANNFESLAACTPVLKWAGGKGRLLAELLRRLPPASHLRRHLEPFCGGAALFFASSPAQGMLADVNPALIHTYEAIRDNIETVLRHLRRLAKHHSDSHYYRVRARYNRMPAKKSAERAAMFLYLNKTCFNGLHRVNRRGEFNVPLGRYTKPRIVDEDNLRLASTRLRQTELRHMDFRDLLHTAMPGDFIYLDPPYAPLSSTANFTSYAQSGFSCDDQKDLKHVFQALDNRGCKLMLSNSDVPLIRELYRDYRIEQVLAPRAISCQASARGPVPELIIRNY